MSEIAWSFVIFFVLVGITVWVVLSVRAKWRRDAEALVRDEHIAPGQAPVDVREVTVDPVVPRDR